VRNGEGKTGIHAPAIDEHRAGAALTTVTPFFGAGQAQMLAQYIEQGDAWIELKLVLLAIDGEACMNTPRRF